MRTTASAPPYLFGRFVAERSEEVLGTASFEQPAGQYLPRQFYLSVGTRAAPLIHTYNDSRNTAMIAISDALRFVRQPAYLSRVHTLRLS